MSLGLCHKRSRGDERLMDCREAQSLIVPFIKGELGMEQSKKMLDHIEKCSDCKEELEVYYILLVGMQQLDEDSALDLDLHGQFERSLEDNRNKINKAKRRNTQKYILTLALVGIVLVVMTNGQQYLATKKQKKKGAVATMLPLQNTGVENRKSMEPNGDVKDPVDIEPRFVQR